MSGSMIKKDLPWKQFKGKVRSLNHSFTKVGYPQEGKAAAGDAPTMLAVVLIAAVHEFGAPKRNIPQRSHIRASFDNEKLEIQRRCVNEYKKVVSGQTTARQGIGRVGEYLTGKTKMLIKNRITPANAPMTIAEKGSDVPLIDTAQMIQSIQHVEVMQ
jgi:hypothetical protein